MYWTLEVNIYRANNSCYLFEVNVFIRNFLLSTLPCVGAHFIHLPYLQYRHALVEHFHLHFGTESSEKLYEIHLVVNIRKVFVVN
jgi:hypothetical protein